MNGYVPHWVDVTLMSNVTLIRPAVAVQLLVSADSAYPDRLARNSARPVRVADIAHRLDGETTRHVDFNRTELLALSRRCVSCDGHMQGCGAQLRPMSA